MYEITLICTHHSELGNCNSSELFKAIYWINPDVIFEELPPSLHRIAYVIDETVSSEIKAVKQYVKKNPTLLQIPVDSYPVPKDLYRDYQRMLNVIEQANLIESQALRSLQNDQKENFVRNGLKTPNSDENDECNLQMGLLREKILSIINDEELFRIHKLEKEVRQKRDYEIMGNIYEYSKENPFIKAIMLIGSGHRKSILNLITKFQEQEELKLNWKIY